MFDSVDSDIAQQPGKVKLVEYDISFYVNGNVMRSSFQHHYITPMPWSCSKCTKGCTYVKTISCLNIFDSLLFESGSSTKVKINNTVWYPSLFLVLDVSNPGTLWASTEKFIHP